MDEDIMCIKEGKDLLIGFNPKFLIEALRVIEDEEVDLYFMNAKAPCFIKDEAQSYIYLILPVILTQQYKGVNMEFFHLRAGEEFIRLGQVFKSSRIC